MKLREDPEEQKRSEPPYSASAEQAGQRQMSLGPTWVWSCCEKKKQKKQRTVNDRLSRDHRGAHDELKVNPGLEHQSAHHVMKLVQHIQLFVPRLNRPMLTFIPRLEKRLAYCSRYRRAWSAVRARSRGR